MSVFHSSLLFLHIALGALCLVLFWLPVFSQKGSKVHNFSGKLYYYCMLFIAGSGIVMSVMVLIDPIAVYAADRPMPADRIAAFTASRRHFSAFLLLLSVLTWVTVRHAYAVLKVKANLSALRNWRFQLPVAALFIGSLYMCWSGWQSGTVLFMIFSGVGFFTSLSVWRYTYQQQVAPRQWIIEHFSSMIATGIALYTAFFAAGGRRLLADILTGHWQIVSWVAAPILGICATLYFKKHFERKFKVSN